MPDKQIECVDCGDEFTFTEGEQKFFQAKFGNDFAPPKRCKPCRAKKKAEKEAKGNGRGNGNHKKRRRRRD
jgi:hypothetical protein